MIEYVATYTMALVFILTLSLNVSALQLNGRLEWVNKIELRSLENGIIKNVNVKLGQHVKKGSILATMEAREFNANLQKSKALLTLAKLNLGDAKDELEREKELYERGLIADEELKDAKIKYAAANAELESAKASQTLAEIVLQRSVLRSPINGIVVAKNAWQGSVIYKTLQKEPLIAIAPSGKMLARLLVKSSLLAKYKPGQAAKVIWHGKTYRGKVYSLGVEATRIDPGGAVYELDILFQYNPNELMRPSDTVRVVLP